MKAVKILSFSDSHLGKNKLDPVLMIAHLKETIFPLLPTIQLLIIAGDLFDEGLGLGDASVMQILAFIIELEAECAKYDITVRILRGTVYHDRTQLQTLPAIHNAYKFKNDLRYFDTVSLEYIERFDMRVLYIPDNTPEKTSDDVMAGVKQLMDSAGWDYVDYVIIHAYFAHVIPENVQIKSKVFRQDQFGFVRRGVLIGHVHQPNHSGMFIYHGSSDRINQGEEEPKGVLLTTDQGDGKPVSFQFIENKNAFVFRTYDLSRYSEVEKMIDHVENNLSKEDVSKPVYIRIQHPDVILRGACLMELKRRHPTVDFTHRSPEKNKPANVQDAREIVDAILVKDAPTIDTLPKAVTLYLQQEKAALQLPEDRVRDMLDTVRKLKP